MLRAQTLVTLKEYHSALFDVNRLIELNPSSEVYQNLHTRLKTQLVWTYYFLLLSYCLFSNQVDEGLSCWHYSLLILPVYYAIVYLAN